MFLACSLVLLLIGCLCSFATSDALWSGSSFWNSARFSFMNARRRRAFFFFRRRRRSRITSWRFSFTPPRQGFLGCVAQAMALGDRAERMQRGCLRRLGQLHGLSEAVT